MPVFFYPLNFDDFLYSNEEIAIAIIFILFIATIEKYFGGIFFDAFMEKARYVRELHDSFTKEEYNLLKNQKAKSNLLYKKTLQDIFQSTTYFLEILLFFSRKTKSNGIHRMYEEQILSSLLSSLSFEDFLRKDSKFGNLYASISCECFFNKNTEAQKARRESF